MKVTQLDCLCVTLLHLLHTAGSERFEVLGPTDPIVAVAGDDIILPCYLKPNISAEDMTVDWLNLDFTDGRVYRYQNHRIIRDDQIPYYGGRTSLFEEELWRGNTSLKLTRVQGTDEGRYKCFIKAKSWYDDFTIQVLVKAVGSKPVVSIEGHIDGGMGLLCESEGWHPEPELVWLDSKGVNLSAGPPEINRDLKGFYRVKQHVIVQETDTNHFTCRVQQSRINEKMETEIHLPSELFHHTSPWRITFIVSCCLGAVTVIGLALAIYCIHNKKEDLTGKLNYLTGKLDYLTGKLVDLRNERDRLSKEKAIVEKDLTSQLDDLRNEREDLRKEKVNLTGKLDDLRKERNEIREEKANLSAQNNYLTEKSDDLTEQRDDLKKEKDDLRKDKDDLSKEKDKVEKDLTSKLDDLKEEMVNLWAQNHVLTGKLANLSAQNHYLKDEKDRLSKEKVKVEKDLTSKLDDLRNERVNLWDQNNYLTGKLINLTGKREVENNPTSKLVDVTLDPDTASSGKGET